MSGTRHFLVCDSWDHAALVDRLCLDCMEDERSCEWSGVYQHNDGRYGIVWKPLLDVVLGPIVDEETGAELLPVVEAVTDQDGNSDWQRVLPEVDGPALP